MSIGAALAVHFVTGSISLAYAFLMPLAVVLYFALLLGVADLAIRFLPRKIWQYDKGGFAVSKKESKAYEKLGIKKWKDKAVPDLGKTAGFAKKNLQGSDEDYLFKFLQETCMGETLHATGIVLSFSALAIFPIADWYFVVFLLGINFIINLLPCMIQRYNRYRLAIVYKFKTRKSVRRIAVENECVQTEMPSADEDALSKEAD